MNLYLISQTVNNDYETYDSAVVAALDAPKAQCMHPNPLSREYPHTDWAEPKDVSVRLIGLAAPDITEPCVILASFNAG